MEFTVAAGGQVMNPSLSGTVQFDNVNIAIDGIPNGLSDMNGTLVFNEDRLQVQTLTATTGGGRSEDRRVDPVSQWAVCGSDRDGRCGAGAAVWIERDGECKSEAAGDSAECAVEWVDSGDEVWHWARMSTWRRFRAWAASALHRTRCAFE